jgi:hypothetical protein
MWYGSSLIDDVLSLIGVVLFLIDVRVALDRR